MTEGKQEESGKPERLRDLLEKFENEVLGFTKFLGGFDEAGSKNLININFAVLAICSIASEMPMQAEARLMFKYEHPKSFFKKHDLALRQSIGKIFTNVAKLSRFMDWKFVDVATGELEAEYTIPTEVEGCIMLINRIAGKMARATANIAYTKRMRPGSLELLSKYLLKYCSDLAELLDSKISDILWFETNCLGGEAIRSQD